MNPPPRRQVLAGLLAASVMTAMVPQAAATAPAAEAGAQEVATTGLATRRESPHMRRGEVLVKVKAPRARGLRQALSRVNARAVAAVGGGVSVVRVPAGRELAVARRLEADPSVAYAEPNYVRLASSHDPAEVGWALRTTRAPMLWEQTPAITGDGVRVAVVDSGVDSFHRELAGRVVRGLDVYGTGGHDDCGHGTAVAGVVAAAHDDRGVAGVAPAATIVPVKVLRFDDYFGQCGGDDAAVVRGIRWAADPLPHGGGADIINLSFGGPQPSAALRDAIADATRRGVLVVAASGNSGNRDVNYPAAYPQVISVGGMRRLAGDLRWWPQSSFGAVDVVAPARDVPIALADRVQPGRIGRACPGDRSRLCSDGTSFAAPHVAGVAALLYQQHPRLRDMGGANRLRLLRQWLLATAPRVARTSGGMDLRAGHGRVDAAAAARVSTNPSAVLLTWQAAGRVLAPTRAMSAAPWQLRLRLTVSRGTGPALAGVPVTFTPRSGGTVSSASLTTSRSGRATVLYSSRAAGTLGRLTAAVDGRALAVDSYVLDRDDNVPGAGLPPSPFVDRLRHSDDIDDVFRVPLFAGETLNARATAVDQPRERVELYLHRAATRDVTDPYLAPVRESPRFEEDPYRLQVKVRTKGVRFLDVYGYGIYRLWWWIRVPDRIRDLTAAPSPFTPDGDGRGDVTRVTWRANRAGYVTVVVRNDRGRVVRRAMRGAHARGAGVWRWAGRNQSGNLVRSGRYSVRVEWTDGRGRRSWAATRVSVRR